MSEIVVPTPHAAPVSAAERIPSMDVLRGAALLGIALMNIVFSGLPDAADFNPKVAGGSTGLNVAAFFLQYIFFDGKMRGIFSIMFGAGSYYLIRRHSPKQSTAPARNSRDYTEQWNYLRDPDQIRQLWRITREALGVNSHDYGGDHGDEHSVQYADLED